MNTGLWNMDSGLAARTRRTRACAYWVAHLRCAGRPGM